MVSSAKMAREAELQALEGFDSKEVSDVLEA